MLMCLGTALGTWAVAHTPEMTQTSYLRFWNRRSYGSTAPVSHIFFLTAEGLFSALNRTILYLKKDYSNSSPFTISQFIFDNLMLLSKKKNH